MKGTIRIISGFMKGKAIPFDTVKYNNAEITPQKVKGALFSILGENLSGKTFVDLYSGSGQIGFEALSRKCSLAVLNEKDKLRFNFIRNFPPLNGEGERIIILNLDAKSAIKYISGRGIKADIVFLDPPYDKEKGVTGYYDTILRDIIESGVLKKDSEIIIQHYSANELSETSGDLKKIDVKKYGSTSLSIYRYADI